jgi:glycosyltransferase involved in cell wall biosynthesis
MRILFVSCSYYFPQFYGGIEACIDNLSRGLTDKGHQVAVLVPLAGGDQIWFRNRVAVRLFGLQRAGEKFGGYRVFREWFSNFEQSIDGLIEFFSPDIMVGHGGACPDRVFTPRSMLIPNAAHIHGMAPVHRIPELHGKGVTNYICCSSFIRSEVEKRLRPGHETRNEVVVLYNPFDPTKYRVSERGGCVTFINPHSIKGVDLALELASAFSDIPFLFVKGWRRDLEPSIETRIRSLRNVTVLNSTEDVRTVYRKTRVLIVPSQMQEGAGRVVTEAQISGIPVIASALGGIPEVLGDGGVLLPHDDIAAWISAVREVWINQELWEQLSQKAAAQAQDERFTFSNSIDRYEAFLAECILSHRTAKRTRLYEISAPCPPKIICHEG